MFAVHYRFPYDDMNVGIVDRTYFIENLSLTKALFAAYELVSISQVDRVEVRDQESNNVHVVMTGDQS